MKIEFAFNWIMFIVIYNFFHFINKTIRLQIIFVFIRKNRIYISCTYLKVEILSSNCWWKKMKLQRSVIINELCFHSKYVYTVVCFDSSDLIYYLCIISVNKNKIFNNSVISLYHSSAIQEISFIHLWGSFSCAIILCIYKLTSHKCLCKF